MDNAEVVTQLETINFYVSESEKVRDELELTSNEHFPQKVGFLVRKYKECVNRILLECKRILKLVQKEQCGIFSLTPEQREALKNVEEIEEIYSTIREKINLQAPI